MKYANLKKPLEYVLLGVFSLYILFPIYFPEPISKFIDSSLGLFALFILVVSCFIYSSTPILGILSIVVAYVMITRSSETVVNTPLLEFAPIQKKRDEEMIRMNPPTKKTLEEMIVDEKAPVGHSNIYQYVDTSFKPISDNTHNASSL